uniref:Serum albumin-like n=1 Tax=Geotrypetes seraphini TaxID=260995 RepID=A0A6P8SGE3_GEOSA|nr:serum albumin-like [Geotrypetes seraphini]
MKWIALISLVILLSFTESRNLNKRDHHEGHHERTFAEMCTDVDPDTCHLLILINCVQYFPKSSESDIDHLVNHLSELEAKCKTEPQGPDCEKSLTDALLNIACSHPQAVHQNDATSECCSKTDHERNTCFQNHKNTNQGSKTPYQRPEAEEVCKNYHVDSKSVIKHFMFLYASRHTTTMPADILAASIRYKAILNECCQDVATAAECLKEKKTDVINKIKMMDAIQQHNCRVYNQYGMKVLQADKLAKVCQTFPGISTEIGVELSHRIADTNKECCEGNVMECLIKRSSIATYVCTNQDKISPNLKKCCDLEEGLRPECIVNSEHDPKPEGMSEQVRQFIDDKEVCDKYKAEGDAYINSFTCAYGARRGHFSSQLILKASNGYEKLLKECCPQEDPVECMGKGEEELKKAIAVAKTLQKVNCDALDKEGSYYYQNRLILKYFNNMPRLPTETLLELTTRMRKIAERCCKMTEEKQFPCGEMGLSMLISEMCQREEKHPINSKVKKCCTGDYFDQTTCFTEMSHDENVVPVPLTPDMFQTHANLCSDSDDAKDDRHKMLIALLRAHPNMKMEQYEKISSMFRTTLDACCKEDDHEKCIMDERPKLLKLCEELLGA